MTDATLPSSEIPSARSVGDSVMLELVREMAAQRQALQEEQREAAAERKREQRWKMAFQVLFVGGPFILGLLYFLFFLNSEWFRFGPMGSVVGVVHINGEIGAGTLAGADRVIPSLESAFSSNHVRAVVLSIDSPGGSRTHLQRHGGAEEEILQAGCRGDQQHRRLSRLYDRYAR